MFHAENKSKRMKLFCVTQENMENIFTIQFICAIYFNLCACFSSIIFLCKCMSVCVRFNFNSYFFNSFSDQFVVVVVSFFLLPLSKLFYAKREREKTATITNHCYPCAEVKAFFSFHFVNYVVCIKKTTMQSRWSITSSTITICTILMHFVKCAYCFCVVLMQFVLYFPVLFSFLFHSFDLKKRSIFQLIQTEENERRNETFSRQQSNNFLLRILPIFRFHLNDNYFSISIVIIIIIAAIARKCVFTFSAIAFMPSAQHITVFSLFTLFFLFLFASQPF